MANYKMWMWTFLVIVMIRIGLINCQLKSAASGSHIADRSKTPHLSCDCPEGFFSKGTLSIFTVADICGNGNTNTTTKKMQDDDGDGSVDPDHPVDDPMEPSKADELLRTSKTTGKLFPMTMKICQRCATGCALCLGPDDNDCLKCLAGYLVNYYEQQVQQELTATEGRKKRMTGNPHQMIKLNPRIQRKRPDQDEQIAKRIYEEEGLLAIYKEEAKSSAWATSSSSSSSSTKTGPTEAKILADKVTMDKDLMGKEMDSSFYVDDNFMSFEADGPSGFDDEKLVAKTEISKPPTSGKFDSGAHQLGTPVIKQESTFLIPENKLVLENKDFDYYGDVESSFIEETIKFEGDLTTTTKSATSTDILSARRKLTEDDAAIEWHGSAPFSCVSSCPENFYADEDNVCQACHDQCAGCHGNGPNHCLRCRRFQEADGRCVSTCSHDHHGRLDDDVFHFKNNTSKLINCSTLRRGELEAQTRRQQETIQGRRIPFGYYALPPLVIVAVVCLVFLGYFRKRYRMQLNLPCTSRGRANRNSNRDHEDHKKCFLNRNKERNPTSSDDLKMSTSLTRNRTGNAYVYATERSLLSPKLTSLNGSLSMSKSASWMTSGGGGGRGAKDTEDDEENFYESDPVYETPDSTYSRRDSKGRRRSSASTQCYLIPSTATLSRKGSPIVAQEDSPDATAAVIGDCATSGFNGCPPSAKKLSTTPEIIVENEAPGFEAPPLPSRNLSNPEQVASDDHIYVNID